jgi:GNAT superfamily N-acetyltransferase
MHDIVETRALTPAQRDERAALLREVFEPLLAVAGVGNLQWASATWAVLVHGPDGALVATAGILTRTVQVNGTDAFVAGVCEVATLPAARGQGLASSAMRRAGEFITSALTVDFGLLLCPPERVAWYGGLGWQQFDGTIRCAHPDGTRPLVGSVPMVLDTGRPLPVQGDIDLLGNPW